MRVMLVSFQIVIISRVMFSATNASIITNCYYMKSDDQCE